jgi:hypothetical protein
MVTTRSSSNRSQQDPTKRPTISGRIEKPKKTPKTPKTPKTKMKVQEFMSVEECEAETNLMRQISIGEV